MRPESHAWQLTNLKLSKRLKELGVKQESLWWWLSFTNKPHKLRVREAFGVMDDETYSAFTVAELGEMLPENLDQKREYYKQNLSILKSAGGFRVMYNETGISFFEKTEADARAKCLIYLLEKGVAKP